MNAQTKAWPLWAALLIMVLAGCATTEPIPTPTATRTPILPTATPTPIPTATPTATATPTVTPSPTLPPSLLLPPTPTTAESCPPLPSDLYFLREGQIWACLAEGGTMERIPIADEALGDVVVEYHITPDRRYIAYVTNAGELFILDRSLWQQTYIPTAGRLLSQNGVHFTLSDDGKILLYLAWGVQSTRGGIEQGGSGTILAMSALTPTLRQQDVALCQGTTTWPCMGFKPSPDMSHIAMIDSRGIWDITMPPSPEDGSAALVEVPAARMVASYTDAVSTDASTEEGDSDTALSLQRWTWSPDGQWLLLTSNESGETALSVLAMTPTTGSPSAATQAIRPLPVCTPPCTVATAWGETELWVAWDTEALGCIGRVNPNDMATQGEDATRLEVSEPFCGIAGQPLHPSAPHLLPDYGPVLIHRGTQAFPTGLYALSQEGGAPIPLAFLPPTTDSALWAPDGTAFIVTDNQGAPQTLVDLLRGAAWDVQDLLEKAHTYRWATLTAR